MDTPSSNRDVSKRRKARALYDNRSECADELAFRRGELLTVLTPSRPPPDGWWLCSLRGRQGLCPANRLRLLPETARDDKSSPKVKLRRAKSMHQSASTDDSPSAFQRSRLRRSASSLSGTCQTSRDPRTCCPATYDTPPSPRIALRVAPVLEYDVPRPPAAPVRSRGSASDPCTPARADHLTPGWSGGAAPDHGGPQPAGTAPVRTDGGSGRTTGYPGRSEAPPHGGPPASAKNSTFSGKNSQGARPEKRNMEKITCQTKADLMNSLEEQEMHMNAVLAELLGSVKTDETQSQDASDRWKGGRPGASSARPQSDTMDSCESSPLTSPSSSQRYSDSTSSSWMAAPSAYRVVSLPVGSSTVTSPISSTVSPPITSIVTPSPYPVTAAPPVCRRTALRLERELLTALRLVQERRRCPSEEAAALSFQLNVTRLRYALRDLLQFISCTAGAGAERALSPLREADRQLERAAGRQEAAGWRSGASHGSAEVGDGMKELEAAVRTLTAHLPLTGRQRPVGSSSRTSDTSTTPDRISAVGWSDPDHGPPSPAAPTLDASGGDEHIKSGTSRDRALTAFHLSQCETYQSVLWEALERLMEAAHGRQGPSALPVLCKFAVLSAHRLVTIGDAVGSDAEDQKAGWTLLTASDQLFIALRRLLRATKAAAAELETITSDAALEMADATRVLSEAAAQLARKTCKLSVIRNSKRKIRATNGAR